MNTLAKDRNGNELLVGDTCKNTVFGWTAKVEYLSVLLGRQYYCYAFRQPGTPYLQTFAVTDFNEIEKI